VIVACKSPADAAPTTAKAEERAEPQPKATPDEKATPEPKADVTAREGAASDCPEAGGRNRESLIADA